MTVPETDTEPATAFWLTISYRGSVILADLIDGERANASIGWIVVTVLIVATAVSLVRNASIWSGLSLFYVAVVAFPAAATDDWTTMGPWPILAVGGIAGLCLLGGLYTEPAGYVIIATLALVIVVEIDLFTAVRLSRRFAVGFAVLTTMALEAIWIIVQFTSDQWLGTAFLSTQTALQMDMVIVTIVSFVIGGGFYWYLIRIEPTERVSSSSLREKIL